MLNNLHLIQRHKGVGVSKSQTLVNNYSVQHHSSKKYLTSIFTSVLRKQLRFYMYTCIPQFTTSQSQKHIPKHCKTQITFYRKILAMPFLKMSSLQGFLWPYFKASQKCLSYLSDYCFSTPP